MPPTAPLITLLLPVYNAARVLPEALESLAAQRFTDWCCLCLDDGSEDESREVAQAFARRDPRFASIALPHRGIPETLNAGLARCQGPLVARMDADDVAAPGRLAAQVALLEAEEAAAPAALGVLVATQIRSFKSDGTPPGMGMSRYVAWVNQILTPADHLRERYVEAPLAHSSALARREVFARGYRDLPFCEDYDLWLDLLAHGVRFAKVPEVLLAVRDDADRISRNDRRYSQDALRACKLTHLRSERGPLGRRDEVLIWGAGRVGKRWLKDLPVRGVRVPAVVDLHPRKLGRRIYGARVVPPEALRREWEALRDPLLLVAVGAPGARDDIRAWLLAEGFAEERDFLVVA